MKGQVKGSVLMHTRDDVLERLGTEGWARVLEKMVPEDREFFAGVILGGGWYPVVHWNRLNEIVLPRLGRDSADGMRHLAAYIAQRDLSSVYRLVMKLGSPEFILRRTGQLWSRYYDTGMLKPIEITNSRWKLELTAPTHIEEAPSAATCTAGVTAWVGSGLLLSGTKATVVESRCRFREGARCEFDVSW